MTPTPATSSLIWRKPGWPDLTAPAPEVTAALLQARQRQGQLLGQCAAVGLDATAPTLRELWVQEAMATSAIEGEQLNPDSVRSSVLRHLGLDADGAAPISRRVDGLVDVLEDATQNFGATLACAAGTRPSSPPASAHCGASGWVTTATPRTRCRS